MLGVVSHEQRQPPERGGEGSGGEGAEAGLEAVDWEEIRMEEMSEKLQPIDEPRPRVVVKFSLDGKDLSVPHGF